MRMLPSQQTKCHVTTSPSPSVRHLAHRLNTMSSPNIQPPLTHSPVFFSSSRFFGAVFALVEDAPHAVFDFLRVEKKTNVIQTNTDYNLLITTSDHFWLLHAVGVA